MFTILHITGIQRLYGGLSSRGLRVSYKIILGLSIVMIVIQYAQVLTLIYFFVPCKNAYFYKMDLTAKLNNTVFTMF